MPDVVKPALHGRDHCPGGEDPIPASCLGGHTVPFFRAYKWGLANQSINNTFDAYISFDRYQTSDSSKMDILGGTWASGTPDYFTVIHLKARGLYAISIILNPDPDGAFTGNFGVALDSPNTEFWAPPFQSWPCTERAGDNSDGQWGWTFIQSFPPIWREQTTDAIAPAEKTLRFNFSNNVGSTVQLYECEIEIHLLYEFDYETVEGTIQSQA